VYVDFQPGNTQIRLNIQIGQAARPAVTRRWNIQIAQIECNSPERGWYFVKEWKCVTTVMWDYLFFITSKVSVFMLDHHTLLALVAIVI